MKRKRNLHYYMTMYMFYRESLQSFAQRGPAKVKQDHVIKRTREMDGRGRPGLRKTTGEV